MVRSIRLLVCSAVMVLAFAMNAQDLRSLNGKPVSPALNDGDFVFVVAGDNRSTAKDAPLPRVLKTIFDEIRLIRPDFVLWTGDTVYGYDDKPEELAKEYDDFATLAKKSE